MVLVGFRGDVTCSGWIFNESQSLRLKSSLSDGLWRTGELDEACDLLEGQVAEQQLILELQRAEMEEEGQRHRAALRLQTRRLRGVRAARDASRAAQAAAEAEAAAAVALGRRQELLAASEALRAELAEAAAQGAEQRWQEMARTAVGRQRRGCARSCVCCVCWERPREAVLVPCGHFALCLSCAGRVKGRCPLCRAQGDVLRTR